MKDYVYFFVVYTVLEAVLSGLYWQMVRTIDRTLVIGFGLYGACMLCGYLSYRHALYRRKRRELLNELL